YCVCCILLIVFLFFFFFFFFSSRRRHTRSLRDWSSDVCSSDLYVAGSAHVTQLLPTWALEGGTGPLLARLSEPDTRSRIVEETRSEERRVGKECRYRWATYD